MLGIIKSEKSLSGWPKDTCVSIMNDMEADCAEVFNVPSDIYNVPIGKAFLCRDNEGQLRYVPATDLQIIELNNNAHWKELREHAAVEAMKETIKLMPDHLFGDLIVCGFNDRNGELNKTYPNEIAQFAVACADSLVNELKR